MDVSLSLTFAPKANSAIVSSFSESLPTRIVSWCKKPANNVSEASPALDGAVVGCEDGSLYFFRSNMRPAYRRSSTGSLSNARVTPITIDLSSPRPSRHLSERSRRSLSPSSPRSPFSPFHLTKSRVVSSVSAEMVEAPKNYVDFEDEQAKLKEMVRRKGVKDKTVVDSLLHGADKTLPDKSATSSAAASARPSISEDKERPSTLASTNLSRASSAQSLSSLASPVRPSAAHTPDENDPFPWSLICHTIPPHHGVGQAVRDLKDLEGRGMVLCLHASGHIEVYSTEDGSCHVAVHVAGGHFFPPSGMKALSKLPQIWTWKKIHLVPAEQSYLVLVTATSEATSSTVQSLDSADGDREDETRVAAFELRILRQGEPEGVNFVKVGDWSLNGPVDGIALCQDQNGDNILLHVDSSGHLLKQTMTFSEDQSAPDSPPSGTNSNTNLALPNPFKALKSLRSSDNLVFEGKEEGNHDRIELNDSLDLGPVPLSGPLAGVQLVAHGTRLRGLLWSNDELCLFDMPYLSVRSLCTISVNGLNDTYWTQENSLLTLQGDRANVYELVQVDQNNDGTGRGSSYTASLLQAKLVKSVPLLGSDTLALNPVGSVLATRTRNGRRRLYHYGLDSSSDVKPHTLWKTRREDLQFDNDAPRVTSICPIELNHVILAYSDGYIARTTLPKLIQNGSRRPMAEVSDIPLPGIVTSLCPVQSDKTGERRIVGGSDDGSIAIWSSDTLKLLARWTVFLEPLAQVIYLSSGRLRGCTFCISGDGTVAIVAVDGCQFLHLVPASMAPLQRICLGEDNLLLCYADGRARLWDIKTREFWRSMSHEKADEMISQGGWSQWPVGVSPSYAKLSALPGVHKMPDAAATLVLDVESFLLQVGTGTLPPGARSSEFLSTAGIIARRNHIRTVLSALLTFSLNEEIDRLCHESLHIEKAPVSVGISSHGATTLYMERGARGPWLISPEVTALHASAIVALLQALLQFEEGTSDTRTVCVFYTASLAQVVGPEYKVPNLAVLALHWLKAKAPELKHASRVRFEASMLGLLDEEVVQLVENWQNSLPSLQEESMCDFIRSAMALFICGTVAIERYKLLQTTCLTDISKSIAVYLHDEASPHRALAIDLCSRGFPVWQQYVDAVEMLRALFTLATSSKKEGISTNNVGQQARTAVLHIASSNTPLFMTTLSIDILQPKSVQHRKSVLQLVIFLIHKKPFALYSNLPRLVEAVVKSLDPSSTASREAVLDSATEILGHIVETYPTVDFHGPTQRLAVGTSEGAVVMYDLKTATRLYVLEGHKRRTTACSFSPDGRRLMTLSLDESIVLVWKVGSSFTSFFMPGAPPRQGHNGSEPYKSFSFNIGEEGIMTLVETLEFVKFEWNGDRSVKVKIRNATLTFST